MCLPRLLSGLKPPIHLKLGRLGVKILHGVAPEIRTEHPIDPLRDRDIESWSHLVPATEKGFPRPHEVRLIEISLIVDRARYRADSELLEHSSAACTDKRSPPVADRIGELDVHHERHLQQISFRIELHRSIEIRISTNPRESSIPCDRVRLDRVVDTTSFKLEIDPLIQSITRGKIETETWIEADRLIANRSIELHLIRKEGADVRLWIIIVVPLGDRHVGVDRTTECNPQPWPWARYWLRLHVSQRQSLGKKIRSIKKHHDQ